MRSRGTPARTASTTRRTTARTSSSGSDADTTRVAHRRGDRRSRRRAARGRGGASAVRTGASARASPLTPATTVTGTRVASTRSSAAAGVDSSCGRWTTTAPRSVEQRHARPRPRRRRRPSGRARRTTRPASDARARRLMRTTSAARGPVRASASSAASSRVASSRCAATSAASVAGCSATGRKRPGASASTARTAAASTGVDTGRRCAAASRRSSEQLGEPVHGEERDPGDAVAASGHAPERAAPEQAARGHAHVVGGDHHRDRRERVARLRRHHRGVQRARRVGPVGNRHQLDGHRPGSYGRRRGRVPDHRGHAGTSGGAREAVTSSSPSGRLGLPTRARSPCGTSSRWCAGHTAARLAISSLPPQVLRQQVMRLRVRVVGRSRGSDSARRAAAPRGAAWVTSTGVRTSDRRPPCRRRRRRPASIDTFARICSSNGVGDRDPGDLGRAVQRHRDLQDRLAAPTTARARRRPPADRTTASSASAARCSNGAHASPFAGFICSVELRDGRFELGAHHVGQLARAQRKHGLSRVPPHPQLDRAPCRARESSAEGFSTLRTSRASSIGSTFGARTAHSAIRRLIRQPRDLRQLLVGEAALERHPTDLGQRLERPRRVDLVAHRPRRLSVRTDRADRCDHARRAPARSRAPRCAAHAARRSPRDARTPTTRVEWVLSSSTSASNMHPSHHGGVTLIAGHDPAVTAFNCSSDSCT